MRYSPLKEITPANVGQLQLAWVYHMKPAGAPTPAAPRGTRRRHTGPGTRRAGAGPRRCRRFSSGETTALVIKGVMYVSTPYGRVVALDPTTGKEKWVFPLPSGSPSTRGVEHFTGDAKTRRRSCSARATASSIRLTP